MPTYTYKCKNCENVFEKFQKMNSDPLKICPVCNQEALTRIIDGGAGLIFKGNGFYITDYKKSGSSNTNKTSSTIKKSFEDKNNPSEK